MQMGISPRSPCILPSTAYTASPSSLSTFTLSISDFLHSLSLSQFSAFFLFVDFASFAFFFFFSLCLQGENLTHPFGCTRNLGQILHHSCQEHFDISTPVWQHTAGGGRGGAEPHLQARAAERERAAGAQLGCLAARGHAPWAYGAAEVAPSWPGAVTYCRQTQARSTAIPLHS